MDSNNNDHTRFQELAEKWLNGSITPAEEKEFAAWYNEDQDAPVFVPRRNAASEEEHKSLIYQNIQQSIEKEEQKGKRHSSFLWMSVAASLAIVLVSVGLYFSFFHHQGEQALAVKTKGNRFQNDVAPGGDKALLTLEDGQVIVLEEAQDGLELKQGNTKVLKLNGSLAYRQGEDNRRTKAVAYNKVSTPRGGQYQIVLADGSKVWLNAASSLKFPTAFVGEQRKVELTGEAYFEIAKNAAMPFMVEAGGVKVEVLGTHFNVMAYEDEKALETTLAEGSVKVSQGEQEKVLIPGQQAVHKYGASGLSVKKVEVEDVLAWKNGVFLFDKADLRQVMRQIQRWYDVEVVYEGAVPSLTFTGVVPRKENVSMLLGVLKLTGGVDFEIKDRTVIVQSKRK